MDKLLCLRVISSNMTYQWYSNNKNYCLSSFANFLPVKSTVSADPIADAIYLDSKDVKYCQWCYFYDKIQSPLMSEINSLHDCNNIILVFDTNYHHINSQKVFLCVKMRYPLGNNVQVANLISHIYEWYTNIFTTLLLAIFTELYKSFISFYISIFAVV